MINKFLNIYKNFYLPHNEILSEIYYVLDIEFHLNKKEILLGKVLDKKNAELACKIFEERVKTGKPIQYIIQKALFMNDIFMVDTNVLIPRDDTQILVETATEVISKNNFQKILDIGTGSGIIAIELKKTTNKDISAIDISQKALDIAQKNAQKLNTSIKFKQSNLFEKIEEKFDMIVSNPPYIPYKEKVNLQKEIKDFEPQSALFADDNGLFFYKKIIKESINYLQDGGCLIFEIGIGQASAIKEIFNKNNFKNIFIKKDVSEIERVIGGFFKA